MFKPLVDQIKGAITGAAETVLGRAAVAVLVLVAGGFATAAALIMLVNTYGAVTACLVLAALFTAIAIVAGAVVSVTEQRREDPEAANSTASAAGSEQVDVVGFIAQDPVLALSAASAALGVLRQLGRNSAILIVALIAAAWFFMQSSANSTEETTGAGGAPTPTA